MALALAVALSLDAGAASHFARLALRCARQGVDLIPESIDASDGPQRRADLALVLVWTGDKDNALAEFTRLLGIGVWGMGGFSAVPINVHVMKRHPFFFPLQGDPRFEVLLNDPKNNAPLF